MKTWVTPVAFILWAGFSLTGEACSGDSVFPQDASLDATQNVDSAYDIEASTDGGGSDGGSFGDAGTCFTDAGCPCGLLECGTACVDVANDALNCGWCGAKCAANQYCSQGSCGCLPGFVSCPGGCIDPSTDPKNCGMCGRACGAANHCQSGSCQSACATGYVSCATTGGVACVHLDAGMPYCGSCGNVCGPGTICAGASCEPYKPATPCTECPCSSVCGDYACCGALPGQSAPNCVGGNSCP